MSETLTDRGTTVCRGCGGSGLVSVLDLGRQALANEMALVAEGEDPSFPLHLRICPTCGLGQLGEYVLPERIFSAEYPYQSSVSTSWVEHAGRYVEDTVELLGLGQDDLVMEVASNDGYLLTQFRDAGIRTLGIEPARGVADIARSRGIETVGEFFGREVAKRLRGEYGSPRLIAANNVMAHVPDLEDFVGGFAQLCDERTVVTVENPGFLGLMQQTQFDTIYHEHFSYLSAHAVAWVAQRFGLELWDIEGLPTHGGSNRYWLGLAGVREVSERVTRAVTEEKEGGLLSPQLWESFARRSQAAVAGLRAWLDERRQQGRVVAGYGAAAKGNTLLNAAGVTARDLAVVVDGSSDKQGRFLPGSHVPVRAPGDLASAAPDDVLILPWNIAPELVPLVASLVPSAQSWAAIPEMHRLS